ncbi:hypothetical protein StoSoilB19_16990 [Arthrobacter sp. StoSoilB19]|nr:hypothetical protein StoSoilB19_16990 [Arthrobacter sp. StoSoilB19]
MADEEADHARVQGDKDERSDDHCGTVTGEFRLSGDDGDAGGHHGHGVPHVGGIESAGPFGNDSHGCLLRLPVLLDVVELLGVNPHFVSVEFVDEDA